MGCHAESEPHPTDPPNFPPGCQFSGGPACYSLPVFHLSSPLGACSLEGLGGWPWAHLVLQKLGWRRGGECSFQTDGNAMYPSWKKVCPCFSPPNKRSPWRSTSLHFGMCLSPPAVRSCRAGPASLRPELQLGLGRRKFVIRFCNGLAKKAVYKDAQIQGKQGNEPLPEGRDHMPGELTLLITDFRRVRNIQIIFNAASRWGLLLGSNFQTGRCHHCFPSSPAHCCPQVLDVRITTACPFYTWQIKCCKLPAVRWDTGGDRNRARLWLVSRSFTLQANFEHLPFQMASLYLFPLNALYLC